eukprot:TRINITY_DN9612_c0_g1_i1.p1 TRINITY_DN9612_c0_g1~~TRINITY_DN9612_c0_g1_i1.p1  ORF type:complete len:162 (+),score=26.99 TRINITY_DN9612_c0_g1_i1:101-586(+)
MITERENEDEFTIPTSVPAEKKLEDFDAIGNWNPKKKFPGLDGSFVLEVKEVAPFQDLLLFFKGNLYDHTGIATIAGGVEKRNRRIYFSATYDAAALAKHNRTGLNNFTCTQGEGHRFEGTLHYGDDSWAPFTMKLLRGALLEYISEPIRKDLSHFEESKI